MRSCWVHRLVRVTAHRTVEFPSEYLSMAILPEIFVEEDCGASRHPGIQRSHPLVLRAPMVQENFPKARAVLPDRPCRLMHWGAPWLASSSATICPTFFTETSCTSFKSTVRHKPSTRTAE